MSEHEESRDFTGASVEEAIDIGLKTLEVSRDQVAIQVIEEGTKGLFGFGSREAVVRITILGKAGRAPHTPQDNTSVTIPERTIPIDDEDDGDEFVDDDADEDEDEDDYGDAHAGTLADDDHVVAITRETVIELLQKMHVSADVAAHMTPKDSYSKRAAVAVDITGDDLSILIGRKAETLEALQYITRLIVGKELSSSVIINIDVQGYKKRKEQRLRRIAQSVARQAVETGRRQYLEPMSAWDRRIVHMELRNHPDVYTESVGEGSRRKVTINPKDS